MQTLGLLAAGVAIRAVMLGVLLLSGATSVLERLEQSDGAAYAALARQFMTGVRSGSLPDGVFPGWPALVALPGALVGYDVAALWGAVLCAAVVPVLFHRLTGDRPLSWLLVVAPPTWLMHSMLGMSEPAVLALLLGALVAFTRDRPRTASLLVAAALLMRPHALAAWVALAVGFWRQRDTRSLAWHVAITATTGALALLWNHVYYGDVFYQLHTYQTLSNFAGADDVLARHGVGRGHWGLPFVHLIVTPFWIAAPLWKVVFIWAHAVAAVTACVVGVRRWGSGPLHDALTIWAVLNTALIVCAGPYWGFHSFDRYVTWALPAYAWLLRPLLPPPGRLWTAAGVVSAIVGWVGLQRHPI
jgi:hypothetical protein